MTNETFCHVVRSATGAAALFAAATLRAATICVSQTASEAWVDGATLCTTIADGVAEAATDGDTVILDDETYVLSADLEVKKAITITSRNGKDLSIIDGNNGRVVKFAAEGTTLDSVTVTKCGSAYSACIGLAVSKGCTISNCVFRQNGNSLSGNARNIVTGYSNSAAQDLTFSCNIVTNNSAPNAPCVYVAGSSTVENCYFADNQHRGAGSSHPGICVHASGNAVVRNNTIVNNRSYTDTSANQASAVYVDGSASVVVENNIIYNNTKGKSSSAAADWGVGTYTKGANRLPVPTTVFVYNCMTDTTGIDGDGNIAADPLLKENDLDIHSASPCRGAANANAPATDLYGTARPSPASIGAVEYVAGEDMEIALAASATAAVQPATVTLTAVTGGSYTSPVSYAFDIDGDGTVDETNATGTMQISSVGAYAPSVTATDAAGKTASAVYAGEIVVYAAEKTVYVDASAANAVKPYATAATATASLADAIIVCPEGGTVLVLDGTYQNVGSLSLSKVMWLKGESGKMPILRKARIELGTVGAKVSDVVFEVAGGSDIGGSVLMTADGVVSNCVFRNYTNSSTYFAAAVYAESGLVTGCAITNVVNRRLCGFNMRGSSVLENSLVADCTVVNPWNLSASTRDRGCALAVTGSATVRNCTFIGNRTAYYENGSFVDASSPACHVDGSFSGSILNCVFADNARQFESGGEYVTTNDVALGAERVSCCAVKDAQCDYSDYTGMVTGGISFKDGTWIPASGSSLVNAGSSDVALASSVDLLGNPRFVGRVDIGCCEASSSPGLTIIVR